MIIDSEGHAIFEEELIAAKISKYYTDLFSTDNMLTSREDIAQIIDDAIVPRITPEVTAELTSIPSTAEICLALFSIRPDKAPGPDGFSACFFPVKLGDHMTGYLQENTRILHFWFAQTLEEHNVCQTHPKAHWSKAGVRQ